MSDEELKKQIQVLIHDGRKILYTCVYKTGYNEIPKESVEDVKKFAKEVGDFKEKFHTWYSRAYRIVELLLPERLEEFETLYRGQKNLKTLDALTAGMSHYLRGIVTTSYGEERNYLGTFVIGLQQQIHILNGVSENLSDTLFNLRSEIRDGLYRSEIETAEDLLKAKQMRAAGAVCGVVIESHLREVCATHKISFRKKNLAISDFNEELKKEKVVDTPTWRLITRCGDIRNMCVHAKDREPTKDEVEDLIRGTSKILSDVF